MQDHQMPRTKLNRTLLSKMDTLAKWEEAYTCMLQVKFHFRLKIFNQG